MSDKKNNGEQGKFSKIFGKTKSEKAASIIALAVSVILIPILFLNCFLIIRNAFNPDEVPSVGSMTPLIVLTESMEPEIHDGDFIIVHTTDPEDININDVISFYDPDSQGSSIVTHRVIDKVPYGKDGEGIAFVTQGDNNDIQDRVPVPAENVIGVWHEFNIRFLGDIILFMQSPWGMIVCIALPIICFIIFEVIKRRRQDKKNQGDIDALKAQIEALKAEKAEKEADPKSESKEEPQKEKKDEPKSESETVQNKENE